MAKANIKATLNALNDLPKLSVLIHQLQSKGPSFMDELYLFTGSNVNSEYITTEMPNAKLCCLKFAGLDLESINKKLLEEEANADVDFICSLKVDKLGSGGKHGTPYIFEIGRTKKLVKLSREIQISKPRNWGKLPPTDLSKLVKGGEKIFQCWLPYNYLDTIYISLDEFTNETMIAGIINHVWKTSPHPNMSADNFVPYVVHDSAAICGENVKIANSTNTEILVYVKRNEYLVGENLMEYCNLGNLDSLLTTCDKSGRLKDGTPIYGLTTYPRHEHPVFSHKDKKRRNEFIMLPSIARGILFSVVYAFHFLHQKVNFIHGDAKISNIFLHQYKGSTTVVWKDQVIDMPFCAKLADYGKSSATLETADGPVRLFWEPESTVTRLFRSTVTQVNPFVPKVEDNTYSTGDTTVSVVYNRLRMLGIPYYKSYDVYMFLVSFFLQPSHFYLLTTYSNFKRDIWDNAMWGHSPSSGQKVYKRIKRVIRKRYGTSELLRTGILIEILKDTSLACDVTTPLLDALASFLTVVE